MSDTTRTITLTGRPPVKINEADWPMIASASDLDHDNEYEFQANRKTKWFVGVRQHQDGRAVVYATYSHSSAFQSERDYAAKRGVLLPAAASTDQIVEAIKDVCDDMAIAEHRGGDDDRWAALMHECIADLPAETL
jgi:hypothetical protein